MIFPYQGDFFHIFHDFPDFSLMVGSLWLTTSPANHRPANFWFFFFNIEMKLWKVVQPQVQLMSIHVNLKFPFSDSFKYK